MRHLLLACVLVLAASVAFAQVPSPTPPNVRIAWDHDGINTDGYALIVDGVRMVVVPTCTGEGLARTCNVPFPAMTPGTHSIVIAAYNAAGEATSAPPLSVVVFVRPGDPMNVRIIIGG